jgi:glycosyltransferase involved in cell wall biosynthesis
VPHVLPRPVVVHTHDLLALRSALGEIPENPTGWSGRLYQRYIRRGFSQAQHFICISKRTRSDLLRLSSVAPHSAAVVYNGMNQRFVPMPRAEACRVLAAHGLTAPPSGWLLHLSGGQWYKNVAGVIRLYAHFAREHDSPPPLWLVGVKPTEAVPAAMAELPPQAVVQFHYGLSHDALQAAYAGALAFLFPSHAEGFGWPIVEAQACGCPVVTTDDAPMNEIGGPETTYLPRLQRGEDPKRWAAQAADRLADLLERTPGEDLRRRMACVAWAQRFSAEQAISGYLRLYEQALQGRFAASTTPLTRQAS